MIRLPRLLLPAVALCVAESAAIGQTLVNSTFVGTNLQQNYSNPANWSPAEVPNNSDSKIYNVTIPSVSANLDVDAMVQNLTVSGQGFSAGGHSYTVIGTATVGNSFLDVSVGTFSIQGALSNFDAITKTLFGGRYSVFGTDTRGVGRLSFAGADIVNNLASISLQGPASMITDAAGLDALRNFAHNLPGGSFSVVARDYLLDNAFTNDGLLTIGIPAALGLPAAFGSSLTIVSLTNYDSQSKRLAGGSYDIISTAGSASGIPPAEPAQLIVAGADIVRNAASITLEVTGAFGLVYDPKFTDENGNNALRNLAENEAGAVFQLKYLTQPFQTSSDFTNAGSVLLQVSSFSIPDSHTYRQISGATMLTGGNITGNVELQGGAFYAIQGSNQANTMTLTPTINGNLTVGAALFDPLALTVNGSVQFSDNSRYFVGGSRSSKGGLTVQSMLSLAGTLEVQQAAPFTIAHAAAISGVFKNAPNGSRIFTIDGQGSYLVTYTSTDVTLSDFQPTTPNPRLLNIASRAQVMTGDNVAIGGFIIAGSDAKNVLLRAIGPSLAQFGVTAPLQDPVIELHDSKGAVVATNDNWRDVQDLEVAATTLAPKDARESAIFAALSPGAYTAVIRGKNDSTGVALVEVYDLSSGSPTKLANISTRGFVDADDVLIGGLIAGGKASDNVHVVVRAIGRGLQSSGVPNFLLDAAMEVRDKNGALVAANDDFGTPAENQATVPSALWPPSATDAATGVTVPVDSYTVIVRGKNGASGVALVEIYDLTD